MMRWWHSDNIDDNQENDTQFSSFLETKSLSLVYKYSSQRLSLSHSTESTSKQQHKVEKMSLTLQIKSSDGPLKL